MTGGAPSPSPKRGAGGCSVPAPVLGGRLGWGSESAQATKRHSPAPLPSPYPYTQGQLRMRPDAPTQARDRPQAACRGLRPRRGYRESPCTKKRWRVGWVGQWPPPGVALAHVPVLGESWEASGLAKVRKRHPLVPLAGCRGRSPRRGYRGCPPVSKNVGGGPVGQRRRPSQTLRSWRAHAKTKPSVPIGGRTPESGPLPPPPPLQNTNDCAIVPP